MPETRTAYVRPHDVRLLLASADEDTQRREKDAYHAGHAAGWDRGQTAGFWLGLIIATVALTITVCAAGFASWCLS